MKVLVPGGTGFIGTHLCRELDERGHDVTALARNPETADLSGGVEAVAGDVTAYDSVHEAATGQDAIVNLVALSPLFKPRGGEEMHDRIHRGGTENCVRAAEETGVDRFLQMSALDADPGAKTAFLRAKGNAEEIVRGSSVAWTIVRPSVVFGEGGEFVPFTRKLAPPYVTPLPGGGKTRFQPIWIGDFAPILADALEGDEHVGETYEIGGPETLTLAEIARMAHRAAGRPVNVVPIPMPMAKFGLAIIGSIPGAPLGSDQYRSLTIDNTTENNDVTSFGRSVEDLRRLEDYLQDQ